MITLPKAYCIKGVLFDFDGTLTRPFAIDFKAIKTAIGCPPDQTILEFIDTLPDKARRLESRATLHAMEMEAAADSHPHEGAEDLILFLKAQGLPVGILTRNSRASVERTLENFAHTRSADFDLVITRDDPVSPKPSPEGVLQAAGRFNIDPDELLLVGDFHFDIQAGQSAGALTVLLDNGDTGHPVADIQPDFTVKALEDVKMIVRYGLPLPTGKFPADLLDDYFGRLPQSDPRLLITPGIGEDTAALDLAGSDTLVITSDPITFVTDRLGYYTVVINANDIATSGATPQWLMTTLLFPPAVSASAVRLVMQDIAQACRKWDITLCGGHTEITDAVSRPIVIGTLTATIERKDLINKDRMRAGDHILLTKGVAVEGTAIIAHEFQERLQTLGVSTAFISKCQHFAEEISILPEAATARRFQGVTAMHDVTEGGLATALAELGVAGGQRLEINMESIPIYPQTARICRLLGIEPLGLIGSGSLLLTCHPDVSPALETAIREDGIPVTRIGRVLEPGEGIEARRCGRAVDWPSFAVDELTRLF
ncbi:MAG: HAD-IA family hydrolase [Desulfobacterales bacterium]|nr:HAD-IA family hydrolase [Desulfobacterales bacterium]